MGHPRRAKDAPSPVELLAIFQAKETGVSLPEISRRTKYAVSSILRWYEKWGSDTAFFEAVSCEVPDLAKEHSFNNLFPDLELQGTFEGCGPVEIKADFSKPLANYGDFIDNEPYTDPDEKLKAYFANSPTYQQVFVDAPGIGTTLPLDPTHRHQGESADEWDE